MSTIRVSNGHLGADTYSAEDQRFQNQMESFLWKLLMLSALAYFVWSDTISIGIGPISIQKTEMGRRLAQRKTDILGVLGFEGKQQNAILLEENELDNLSFALDPGAAARFELSSDQVDMQILRCSQFVKNFSPIAIAEMRRYGVPASILLAQALLASNAGELPLARETNNFFLRPCQSSACKYQHFEDLETADEAAVMDVFPNLWGSFRAQSLYLRQTASFSNLFQGKKMDCQEWAEGLQNGGCNADRQYGKKLLAVIQALQLEAFDAR